MYFNQFLSIEASFFCKITMALNRSCMYFLIDEQISSFCLDQPEAEAFNPNNATQTYLIFVNLKKIPL